MKLAKKNDFLCLKKKKRKKEKAKISGYIFPRLLLHHENDIYICYDIPYLKSFI